MLIPMLSIARIARIISPGGATEVPGPAEAVASAPSESVAGGWAEVPGTPSWTPELPPAPVSTHHTLPSESLRTAADGTERLVLPTGAYALTFDPARLVHRTTDVVIVGESPAGARTEDLSFP